MGLCYPAGCCLLDHNIGMLDIGVSVTTCSAETSDVDNTSSAVIVSASQDNARTNCGSLAAQVSAESGHPIIDTTTVIHASRSLDLGDSGMRGSSHHFRTRSSTAEVFGDNTQTERRNNSPTFLLRHT